MIVFLHVLTRYRHWVLRKCKHGQSAPAAWINAALKMLAFAMCFTYQTYSHK